MKPDLFLNRSAIYVFIIFFLFALWAFWPGYFSPLIESKEVAIKYHTHGLGMMMWCMMLISQALLIRINKNSIHRLIGKFSYLLVPYIFFSTLDLVHSLMAEVTTWGAIDLFNLALMVNATFLFVLLFALAIYHRKHPGLHARYMVSTIFPLFTPVTDRLIHHHFKPILALVPKLEGIPLVPTAGFLLADILLLCLVVWDWSANKRKDAFLTALILVMVYHITTLTLYQFDFWRSFGVWFAGLW